MRIFLYRVILIISFLVSPALVFADTPVAGTVNLDTVWDTSGSPYIVDSVVTVSPGVTLTIEQGTVVKFGIGGGIDVFGNLVTQSLIHDGIVFTATSDDSLGGDTNGDGSDTSPAAGSWQGITFEGGSQGDLSGTTIRYAGKNHIGGIFIRGSLLTLHNVDVNRNSGYGLYQQGKSTTTVTSSTFSNQPTGMFVAEGSVIVKNSTIINNGIGILTHVDAGIAQIEDNIFSQNHYPLQLHLGRKTLIHSGNTLTDNDINAIYLGGESYVDYTLDNHDGPFVGGFQVNAGTTVTVNPGTVLKFEKTGLINVFGSLIVKGTSANKVYFTSVRDDSIGGDTNNDGNSSVPTSQDWMKITGINQTSVLDFDNVVMRYGSNPDGASDVIRNGAMVRGFESNIFISNSDVSNSNIAVVAEKGNFSIASSTIEQNSQGIITIGNGSGTVKGSSFSSTTSYAVYNQNPSGFTVSASGNWWGDATGPYHGVTNISGNGPDVSDGVDFVPWLAGNPLEVTGPAPLKPIIIIPGILGSARKNGEWIIDPIYHVYDNLLESLRINGYVDGKTLFTFPYDWRNSNVDSGALLKEKIDEVKLACSCNTVDIVAHSMGGLVARVYAQSSGYEQDIDHLIFLGTPHKGAPKDYLAWEAGEFPKDTNSQMLKSTLKKDARHLGFNNLYDYIKNYPIRSVEQLLSVEDYLKIASTSQMLLYPLKYPENIFLENLNQGIVSFLSSDINVSNIIGNIGTSTISTIRIVPSQKLPLWKDGYPQNFDSSFGDQGLELGIGDGTVPKTSASLGSFDAEINSSHIKLPTEAVEEIYYFLNGKQIGNVYKIPIPARFLFAKIFSPADIVVIAPDGKRVGKDFATGQEINEIPGAFYSGFDTDDEYVVIPNPLLGEYNIETIGTDNGGQYTLVVSDVSDSQLEEGTFTGYTLPNFESSVSFSVSASSSPIVVTPDDTVLPTAMVLSPKTGDYERSAKLLISATSTDNMGIATSSLLFAGRGVLNGQSIDLFYEKLGSTTIVATAIDFQGNSASASNSIRIISTASSTISDIERSFSLGWIMKKNIKNELIQKLNRVLRAEKRIETIAEKVNGKNTAKKIEKVEMIIDKILGRALILDLKGYTRDKINLQAYTIIKEDLEWLINN